MHHVLINRPRFTGSPSSNMTKLLDCECVIVGGGRMPAAQENCEIHLLTTSATGETSLGAGITGSCQHASLQIHDYNYL